MAARQATESQQHGKLTLVCYEGHCHLNKGGMLSFGLLVSGEILTRPNLYFPFSDCSAYRCRIIWPFTLLLHLCSHPCRYRVEESIHRRFYNNQRLLLPAFVELLYHKIPILMLVCRISALGATTRPHQTHTYPHGKRIILSSTMKNRLRLIFLNIT